MPRSRNSSLINRMLVSVFLLAVTCGPSGYLLAQQESSADDKRSEIGERQRMVERRMAELETKFEIIAQRLEAKEPERAKRLVMALQQAKEKLIAKKMNDITSLLDQEKYEEAEQELEAVIVNLEELVRLLLNEKDETMSRQDEIEMLKKWKEQIKKIKNEQEIQTRETSKIANKEETLGNLAEQIKEVERLIRQQKQLIDETQQNRDRGLQALDRLANKQYDVRQATEQLAKEISGESQPAISEDPSTPTAESDKPAEKPPGEDANSKPGNQANESDSAQPAGDSNEPQNQPSQSQGQPPGSTSKPKQAGQKQLENASQNQKQAEQKLADGKATDAIRSEEKAHDDLKAALAALKKEQRRIVSLPPEAFEKMSRDQRRTRDKTADLAKEMQKAPKSDQQGQQGKPGQAGQQQQKKQPGQQNVQRAQKAMQNAADDLSEQDPQRAERQQEKSEEELEKALREIEDRLDQLREETREEKLARLEARFREMLARQQITTILTMELDEKKTHLNRLRRRDVLAMLRLSTEELEISELGQQAYDLLLEDGTSIVFPEMVQNVREDLGSVAQFLESEQTGPLTQLVQHEVESTLEELLEALKKTRKQSEGKSGGGGGGGNQPLLRKSAELKMLRTAQLRVNRLTKQFDLIRPEGKLPQELESEVDKIKIRQADIVEMMIRVMEKQ